MNIDGNSCILSSASDTVNTPPVSPVKESSSTASRQQRQQQQQQLLSFPSTSKPATTTTDHNNNIVYTPTNKEDGHYSSNTFLTNVSSSSLQGSLTSMYNDSMSSLNFDTLNVADPSPTTASQQQQHLSPTTATAREIVDSVTTSTTTDSAPTAISPISAANRRSRFSPSPRRRMYGRAGATGMSAIDQLQASLQSLQLPIHQEEDDDDSDFDEHGASAPVDGNALLFEQSMNFNEIYGQPFDAANNNNNNSISDNNNSLTNLIQQQLGGQNHTAMIDDDGRDINNPAATSCNADQQILIDMLRGQIGSLKRKVYQAQIENSNQQEEIMATTTTTLMQNHHNGCTKSTELQQRPPARVANTTKYGYNNNNNINNSTSSLLSGISYGTSCYSNSETILSSLADSFVVHHSHIDYHHRGGGGGGTNLATTVDVYDDDDEDVDFDDEGSIELVVPNEQETMEQFEILDRSIQQLKYRIQQQKKLQQSTSTIVENDDDDTNVIPSSEENAAAVALEIDDELLLQEVMICELETSMKNILYLQQQQPQPVLQT